MMSDLTAQKHYTSPRFGTHISIQIDPFAVVTA